MKNKTYTVKGNKTAADVVAGNDEILETGYSQEEAVIAAIEYKRTFRYAAAWIEEEAGEPASRPARPAVITRSVERNPRGTRISVVRCDGWAV